jgi:hypothetical protein
MAVISLPQTVQEIAPTVNSIHSMHNFIVLDDPLRHWRKGNSEAALEP